MTDPRFLGMRITPLNARRLHNFRNNRRGYWSLILFSILFVASLFAEVIANDKPVLIYYDGDLFTPVFAAYPETAFGGEFETEAEYHDPFVQDLINEKGWMIWPLIKFSYDSVNMNLSSPAPSPPDGVNWMGTDDQGRDVIARLIYGFRISVLFGLTLTIIASAIGIFAGAVQGYMGGRVDLYTQRFIEIWSGLPILYVLILLASVVEPSFWWLLLVMLLFSWMALVGVVRAEFLKARNYDFVQAAKALGAKDSVIMWRHVLPNAMVATLTFMPFNLTGAITSLTALDFLGFGLPPGSASLGELLAQGKNNPQAPWLGLSAFFVLSIMLTLLVFVGEAVRDAFDPRKIFASDGPAEIGPASKELAEEQAAKEAPKKAGGQA